MVNSRNLLLLVLSSVVLLGSSRCGHKRNVADELDQRNRGSVVSEQPVDHASNLHEKDDAAPLESLTNIVYFAPNKADLSDSAKNVLDAQARAAETDKRVFVVAGHTDTKLSREAAFALANRRAHVVKQYLMSRGVKPEQMSLVSYGKERLANKGDTEDAHAHNRRVEMYPRLHNMVLSSGNAKG